MSGADSGHEGGSDFPEPAPRLDIALGARSDSSQPNGRQGVAWGSHRDADAHDGSAGQSGLDEGGEDLVDDYAGEYAGAAVPLAQSQARAWRLLQALPDPVLVTDTNGVIELVNDQVVALLGYQRAELIGQPVECLVPLGLREVHRRHRSAYVTADDPVPMGTGPNVVIVRKDGRPVPVEVRINAVTLSTGRAVLAILRDVSERKRAEEELRISDELFRASFEQAPIAMAVIDLRHQVGRFLRVNQALCRLTGYNQQDLLSMTSSALTHPVDRPATSTALQQLARGLGAQWSAEKRYLTSSGGELWVHQALSVVCDGEGLPAYAVSQIEDVSDRRRSETQLLERFHELADNIDVGFLIRAVDTDEFVYLNPAFCNILGFPMGGSPPTDTEFLSRFDADDAERVKDIVRQCRLGHRVEAEFRVTLPGGEEKWVSAKVSPIIDSDQQIRRLTALFQDVTDRRFHEEALALARTEAEEANAAKSEFLSRLSHELRTPLNAVIGFGQLLELSHLAPDEEEAVRYILSGGRHLLDMIDDILAVSRIDAGRLDLAPEDVDVSDLIHETIGLMEPLAAANGITLGVTSIGKHCVNADRRRLTQALLNLTSNAIKYNRPGGDVHFSASEAVNGEVAIAITDTGLGIAAEKLPRLFNPFDRLGWESSPVEGTGIGLTLTQRLVTLMNGRLDVVSTEGAGSTFTIILPSAAPREAPVPSRAAEADAKHGRPVVEAAPKCRLLYIEDNPANVALLNAAISHRPGWTITHAGNGRDGLHAATQLAPTLILLDLHLPDMGGMQVLRQLKDDASSAAVPVAILSADANPTQIARLIQAGAERYLTKPVDLPELFALLDEHANDGPNGKMP